MGCMYRIGTGYDVHRLVAERRLILGGVQIPWEKGLLGHSDADVLIHAVMDAMLGACGQLAETPKGSGTFMVNLLDALSTASGTQLEELMNVEEIK